MRASFKITTETLRGRVDTGLGRHHDCGMQMRHEYETGPDRNSGTGRLPSDYQEVSVQMMTPAAWERTLVLARRDGLGEAEMAGLAIGCPVHGNASMDWDADGVFCSRCDMAATAAKGGK